MNRGKFKWLKDQCEQMLHDAEDSELIYGDKCIDATLDEIMKLFAKYNILEAGEKFVKKNGYEPTYFGLWTFTSADDEAADEE